jgi:autotransporter-associated beta strand protein
MKIAQRILTVLAALGAVMAATSVIGQTTYTWIGTADGTNLDTPANYTTNGVDPAMSLPDGLDGSGIPEIVSWDGRTTGNLNLFKGAGTWRNTGFASIGVNFLLTANQANDVRIAAPGGAAQNTPIDLFCLTNNSPHSSLILGTNWDGALGSLLTLVTRPAGAVHYFVNNSTAPVIFNESIEWEAGGGNAYTLDFSGPGDFIANSMLQSDNSGGVSLQVDGPGTVIWNKVGYGVTGPLFGAPSGIGLVTVGSKLIVKSAGNFAPKVNPSTITINNGATLVFDAPSKVDTIDRAITGAGALVVSNGTFTLSGTNDFTGDTTIDAGRLVFQGPKTGTGNITVADGAALGVFNTGVQVTPATLTLGTSAGCALEFNSVTNRISPVISAANLSSTGTVIINVYSGTFLPGLGYPLLSWTSGSTPSFSPGILNLGNTNFIGRLVVNGNTLLLGVSNTPINDIWTGAADGTNLDTPGNYTTNGVDPAATLPNGLDFSGVQQSIVWDGRTTSNLNLGKNSSSWPNTGLGTIGIDFVMTANQTNDVRLAAAAGVTLSGLIGFYSITNNSPHSSLILGTNFNVAPGNLFRLVGRPAGATHYFVNNSTAPVIFGGSIEWLAGGGSPYTLDFKGPGDFIANTSLQADNGGSVSLQVDGPGALVWTKTGYGVDNVAPLSGIGLVNVGSKLIVKSAGNFSPKPFPSTITVSNGAALIFDAPGQSDLINRDIVGGGALVVSNGTFTLTGTNTYGGGTTISAGTLQVGTNGLSGALGSGNVTNNGSIIFNRADTLTVSGNVSGSGSVTFLGSGNVILSGNNTFTGAVTVSNGTLAASSIGGTVNLNGGALAQSVDGTIGALTVGGDLNVVTGTVVAALNRSYTPSNTVFQVTGAIGNSGGILKLLNFGPTLSPGDQFKIFNKPVAGGNSMAILSPGFTVNNHIGTDGAVTVTGVQPAASDTITASISGGQLSLSWPAAWTGLHLQVQTNVLGTNWISIPGTDSVSNYLAGVTQSNACVFFRLAP